MAHSLTDLPFCSAFMLLTRVVVVLVVGVAATGIFAESGRPGTSTHA
jgi:hypothetical protein